jgi:hypothetical protein
MDDDPPLFGGFRIEEQLATSGDLELSRARDPRVDRTVLLRVARGASATYLLEDARRIAAVSHPHLVVLLGAGPTDDGGYAAVSEPDALPLSDAGVLTSDDAARIGIDIAGAIAALADAGVRALISADTVLVSRTARGVHGLLDPLRAIAPGGSCLSDSDAKASTAELADVLEGAVSEPSDAFRHALADPGEPASLARDLEPLVAPGQALQRVDRRRAIGAVAICLAIAAIAVAVVALRHRHESASTPIAARHVPSARIVARIPLGLPKQEVALSFAGSFVPLGGDIWVATSAGRLVRIASGTNQVVGSPIRLAGKHPLQAVVASGGNLYTADWNGWLLRVDPDTGKVTARQRLATHLAAMTVQAGVLWIVSNDGSRCAVLRVDAATFRPIGKPINALPGSDQIIVSGSRAWVLAYVGNMPKVVRIDVASGARRVLYVGPEAYEIALHGHTLWIPDGLNGTVSALDAESMLFARPPLLAPRAAYGVLPLGRDLWVTSTDTLDADGRLRIERFDAQSGRRVGDAVVVGSHGSSILSAFGSLWVFTRTTVVRVAPTRPRPGLAQPGPSSPAPHALRPGPLEAATWRTPAFVAPFTLSTPAFVWLADYPESDSVTLDTTTGVAADLEIDAPLQVFSNDKSVHAIGSPANLLRLLRGNPHLVIGSVHHVTIGGRPALQFTVRAHRPAHHPEVCGPLACTLLFPIHDATDAVGSGQVIRLSLLRSAGRTLVVEESGGENGGDLAGLARSATLLRTVRFRS